MRASRRSNLTPSQLASIRGRLESAMGGPSRGNTPPTAPANPTAHTQHPPQRSTSPPADLAPVQTGVQVKQLVLGLERTQHDLPPPPPTASSRQVTNANSNPSTTAPPDVTPLALPRTETPLLAIVASSSLPLIVTLPQHTVQPQSQAQRDAMQQARTEVSAVVAKLKFDVLAWAEASAFQLNQYGAPPSSCQVIRLV